MWQVAYKYVCLFVCIAVIFEIFGQSMWKAIKNIDNNLKFQLYFLKDNLLCTKLISNARHDNNHKNNSFLQAHSEATTAISNNYVATKFT